MFGQHHVLSGQCALCSRKEFTSERIHTFFDMQSTKMQCTKVERIIDLHETFLKMAETGIAQFFRDEHTQQGSVFGFHKINVVEPAAWSRELVACGTALESNKETTYPKNKVYELFQLCGIKAQCWRSLIYHPRQWRDAWNDAVKQRLTFTFLQASDTMRQGQYVSMQELLEDKNKKNMDARVWTFDRNKFERQKYRAEVGAGKKRKEPLLPLEMLCNVALRAQSTDDRRMRIEVRENLSGGVKSGVPDPSLPVKREEDDPLRQHEQTRRATESRLCTAPREVT